MTDQKNLKNLNHNLVNKIMNYYWRNKYIKKQVKKNKENMLRQFKQLLEMSGRTGIYSEWKENMKVSRLSCVSVKYNIVGEWKQILWAKAFSMYNDGEMSEEEFRKKNPW